MKNLYQIRSQVVISSINGALPTDAEVCLPVTCLIFGFQGSLYINTKNGETSQGNCFIIEADTTFKATREDCKGFVIIFFDAVSSEHNFLNAHYGSSGVTKLEWKGSEELLNKAFLKMSELESDIFLDEIFSELFKVERKNISHKYDNRIILIDDYIRKNIREKFDNKELANKVCLSESRFYHFFKEQTQVTVSRYILWLRLKAIFERYFKSQDKLSALLAITNFTDLPHFIKSFKSFFGESPKRLLNK